MMRLWAESYSKSTSHVTSAGLSIVAHAVVFTAWIVGTMPPTDLPEDSLANRVYYIPPPDRTPGQRGTRETVAYVTFDVGPGIGDGTHRFGDEPSLVRTESVGSRQDSATTPPTPAVAGPPDSVFSVLEVDTPVARSPNSAAPAYPLKLLADHIMGTVSARYVVDTTGFADTASFNVISATNPEFVTAVRDALPYMRFAPAKIGKTKVRQLVEQQFTFRISDPPAAAVVPKKP
jgi:protein TonB